MESHAIIQYLLKNYHILGILLIVTVIAVKLFLTTRQAKKFLSKYEEKPKLDEIIKRLDRMEKILTERRPHAGM